MTKQTNLQQPSDLTIALTYLTFSAFILAYIAYAYLNKRQKKSQLAATLARLKSTLAHEVDEKPSALLEIQAQQQVKSEKRRLKDNRHRFRQAMQQQPVFTPPRVQEEIRPQATANSSSATPRSKSSLAPHKPALTSTSTIAQRMKSKPTTLDPNLAYLVNFSYSVNASLTNAEYEFVILVKSLAFLFHSHQLFLSRMNLDGDFQVNINLALITAGKGFDTLRIQQCKEILEEHTRTQQSSPLNALLHLPLFDAFSYVPRRNVTDTSLSSTELALWLQRHVYPLFVTLYVNAEHALIVNDEELLSPQEFSAALRMFIMIYSRHCQTPTDANAANFAHGHQVFLRASQRAGILLSLNDKEASDFHIKQLAHSAALMRPAICTAPDFRAIFFPENTKPALQATDVGLEQQRRANVRG